MRRTNPVQKYAFYIVYGNKGKLFVVSSFFLPLFMAQKY